MVIVRSGSGAFVGTKSRDDKLVGHTGILDGPNGEGGATVAIVLFNGVALAVSGEQK